MDVMSALGQKRILDWRPLMSALPPKADIVECDGNVRFVPTADIPPSRLKSRTFALLATDDRALQCSGWSGDAARSPASVRPRRDWQTPRRYWARSPPPLARVRPAPWPAAER